MRIYRVESRYSYKDDQWNTSIGPYGTFKEIADRLDLWKWKEENDMLGEFDYISLVPYEGNSGYDDRYDRYNNIHPSPLFDQNIVQQLSDLKTKLEYYKFAFRSLDQLRHWFNNDELCYLELCGNYISIYEYIGSTINIDLIVTKHQVLYIPDDFKLVDCIHIEELLNIKEEEKYYENCMFPLSD